MRNTAATLEYLRREVGNPHQSWYRLCLGLQRVARDLPPRDASAQQAWDRARVKHPLTPSSNFSLVPLGAMIFYRSAPTSTSGAGHVTGFAGVRNGTPSCYTNDVAGSGKVSLSPVLWFLSHWGQTLLGWTEDCNGVHYIDPIHPAATGPQPPNTVSLKAVVRAAKADPGKPGQGVVPGSGDDVRRVENALVAKGLLARELVDGHYGTGTVDAYTKWQRRLGYTGKDADGIPGQVSLRRLAEGQPWRVIG
jgi:hypothetical protein